MDQPLSPSRLYEVYMRFPGNPFAYCKLQALLGDEEGPVKSAFQAVAPDGLGHNIGLRAGDVLMSINKTDVTEVSVPSIIDTLKWLSVDLPILIGVRRGDPPEYVYYWFLFELRVNNDGKPYIHVISSQSNNTGIIPTYTEDMESVYTFQYLPPPEKNEIVQSISTMYLTVSGAKIEFSSGHAQFLIYKYSSTAPASNGNAVALVYDAPGYYNCIETVKYNSVVLQLTDFPNYMKNPNDAISSNGRFFFQKADQNSYETFQSETQQGYYITQNPNNNEAYARRPNNQYSDMSVYDQGPA